MLVSCIAAPISQYIQVSSELITATYPAQSYTTTAVHDETMILFHLPLILIFQCLVHAEGKEDSQGQAAGNDKQEQKTS